MNNKYQEALNDIINNFNDRNEWGCKNDSFALIQELIDDTKTVEKK